MYAIPTGCQTQPESSDSEKDEWDHPIEMSQRECLVHCCGISDLGNH